MCSSGNIFTRSGLMVRTPTRIIVILSESRRDESKDLS